MHDLHSQNYSIKFKQGLSANINSTATKNSAVLGEPHYCTDTGELYVFDGTLNVKINDFFNGGDTAGADRTLGNSDAYALGFKTNGTIRIYIQSDGKVGIGTTSPTEKLTVEWATGVDAGFFRGTTDTDITGTFMRSPNGTLYYTWVDDTGAFQSSTTKP